jgi:hypothetical protein
MTRRDTERFDRQLLLLRACSSERKVLAVRLNMTKAPLMGEDLGGGDARQLVGNVAADRYLAAEPVPFM